MYKPAGWAGRVLGEPHIVEPPPLTIFRSGWMPGRNAAAICGCVHSRGARSPNRSLVPPAPPRSAPSPFPLDLIRRTGFLLFGPGSTIGRGRLRNPCPGRHPIGGGGGDGSGGGGGGARRRRGDGSRRRRRRRCQCRGGASAGGCAASAGRQWRGGGGAGAAAGGNARAAPAAARLPLQGARRPGGGLCACMRGSKGWGGCRGRRNVSEWVWVGRSMEEREPRSETAGQRALPTGPLLSPLPGHG